MLKLGETGATLNLDIDDLLGGTRKAERAMKELEAAGKNGRVIPQRLIDAVDHALKSRRFPNGEDRGVYLSDEEIETAVLAVFDQLVEISNGAVVCEGGYIDHGDQEFGTLEGWLKFVRDGE